jgi:hypothetical protein
MRMGKGHTVRWHRRHDTCSNSHHDLLGFIVIAWVKCGTSATRTLHTGKPRPIARHLVSLESSLSYYSNSTRLAMSRTFGGHYHYGQ